MAILAEAETVFSAFPLGAAKGWGEGGRGDSRRFHLPLPFPANLIRVGIAKLCALDSEF